MEHRQHGQFSTAVSARNQDKDPYTWSLSQLHLLIQSFLFSFLQQGILTTGPGPTELDDHGSIARFENSQLEVFVVRSVPTCLQQPLSFFFLWISI